MTDAALLAAYKRQPHLEREHHVTKSVIEAAPVLPKRPERIGAFSLCWYTALLVHALVERELRRGTDAAGIVAPPLYPERRPCASPTAARVLEPLVRTHITHAGRDLAVIEPELTPLQAQLLELLGMPSSAYQTGGGRLRAIQ